MGYAFGALVQSTIPKKKRKVCDEKKKLVIESLDCVESNTRIAHAMLCLVT